MRGSIRQDRGYVSEEFNARSLNRPAPDGNGKAPRPFQAAAHARSVQPLSKVRLYQLCAYLPRWTRGGFQAPSACPFSAPRLTGDQAPCSFCTGYLLRDDAVQNSLTESGQHRVAVVGVVVVVTARSPIDDDEIVHIVAIGRSGPHIRELAASSSNSAVN